MKSGGVPRTAAGQRDDVPHPESRTDHVLVRITSTNICGSDPYRSQPGRIGHENVGEVIEVGAAVEGRPPVIRDDPTNRVAGRPCPAIQDSCGHCALAGGGLARGPDGPLRRVYVAR